VNTITFFNSKGGVGKTTLVYHVAWMCAELNRRVLAVDLDPQANLTTMLLSDDQLAHLWPEAGGDQGILQYIKSVTGPGNVADPPVREIRNDLYLLPGDLGLSELEGSLSDSWSDCLNGKETAFDHMNSLHRAIQRAADEVRAEVVLVDLGPTLGALNRAAIVTTEHIIVPLSPGMLSLMALQSVGSALQRWREGWEERLAVGSNSSKVSIEPSAMNVLGYVLTNLSPFRNGLTRAQSEWASRVPEAFARHVMLDADFAAESNSDPNRIGLIKNYPSLILLADDARKPMFKLTPADGAIGAHAAAVIKCYLDFKELTLDILKRTQSEASLPKTRQS
jgi:chromosome partitioning protein